VSVIETRLAGCRVVICAGAGGVGKTSISAALAIGLAAGGRRVAVVTIDPARRLAQALGLDELGNEPRRIDPASLSAHGLGSRGELWAMMLDAKRTLDELIERLAPDDATRDAILGNEIYRRLSSAVAGSQEYSAILKLHDIVHDGRFDVVVLDTPPSRNALDFLDAPDRLTAFLEGPALRIFLAPTGLARALSGGASATFAMLRRVTGVALLRDLAVFFQELSGLMDGFRRRASDIDALFRDPATRFVVITSAARGPVDEAVFFTRRLQRAELSFAALIVNRVHALDPEQQDEGQTAERLAAVLGAGLARRVARTHAELQVLARRDAAGIRRLGDELGETQPVIVGELDADVHDLTGLVELHAQLLGRDAADDRARDGPGS
jgi:anion-transporting  ArsA/GET3 family ATPase